MTKTKLFGFINGANEAGGVNATILSDRGDFLLEHAVEFPREGPHFVGLDDDKIHHDIYEEYAPDGFELEWIDDIATHAGVQAAYALHRSKTSTPLTSAVPAILLAFVLVASSCVSSGCASLLGALSSVPAKPAQIAHSTEIEATKLAEYDAACHAIWQEELGRPIDDPALEDCVVQIANGRTADAVRDVVRESTEYKNRQAELEQQRLDNEAAHRPLPSKASFAQRYQGNFGSIKVSNCDFYNDNLFDPVDLLISWLHNKPCFDAAMEAHAERNDNRVVVDPRADYHGQGGFADLWHDPTTFAAYIRDIRSHSNSLGEPFEVLLFLAGDGHIASFLKHGAEGVPDEDAEAHFDMDVTALAAMTKDLVAGTAVCWECRHQRNYITPGTYERNGKLVAREFPNSWHGQHLISGSSSWSSWRCDPEQDATCPASSVEGDDPNRGNEPRAWERCVRDGWCDGQLFQFAFDDSYLNPDRYPNYTGQPGALGRFWEVVVRAGNDPQSIATSGGNRHGWVQFDVIAFEHIYREYNNESTEKYAIEFCKRALAIGGWGCGSASYRRP